MGQGNLHSASTSQYNQIKYDLRRCYVMARTANVFARIEPEVKEQAEHVLERKRQIVHT